MPIRDKLSHTVPRVRTSVSHARWQSAQSWEERHWVGAQRARARYGKNIAWRLLASVGLVSRYRGDDWNYWWRNQFQGYHYLPDQFANVIELGCGPYTNLRLIAERRRFDRVVLSDPLIRTYAAFNLTYVSDLYRSGRCILDAHAIEDSPFLEASFDLVVMINVLDHVRDADSCMSKAIEITRSGGWLIFGQDLAADLTGQMSDGHQEDIGHPIKVDRGWVDGWIGNRFSPILQKVLPRLEGRNPARHQGTYVFAGTKRSGSIGGADA